MVLAAPALRLIRAYLPVVTDAPQAQARLNQFAQQRGVTISNYYPENQAVTRQDRHALVQLLADSQAFDLLLVEEVEHLAHLSAAGWDRLKNMMHERQVRVVAINVPSTWHHLTPTPCEFDDRMFSTINDMLIDMLDAIVRRDREHRREQQAHGILKAKIAGKYRGRQSDPARYEAINNLLASGSSWSKVQSTVGCSRSTISKAIKYMAAKTSTAISPVAAAQAPADPLEKTVVAILWFGVENGSKFTRGKGRVKKELDDTITAGYGQYQGKRLANGDYRIEFHYTDEEDLKNQIEELLDDIRDTADWRNCVVHDWSLQEESSGRHWCDYEGGWK